MEPDIENLRERVATLEREVAAMKIGLATLATKDDIADLRREIRQDMRDLGNRIWQIGIAGVGMWITVVLAILFT